MRTLAVVGAVANVQLLVHAEEDLRRHIKGHRSASALHASCRACTPQKQENVVVQCILLHSFGNMYLHIWQLTESIGAVSHVAFHPPPGQAHMTSGLAPKRLARASSISLVSYVVLSLG